MAVIIIRSQQLAAFVQKEADVFVDELVAEVARDPTEGARRPVVLAGIASAMACGFQTPEGIRGFVRRLFVLGTGYYRHAAVRDWISEPGLTETERLAVIDAHADEIGATDIPTMRRS
ncbi:hypothetical protein ACFFTM_03035 [Pseudoduganella plicata]|uniref:Uncharacterized protein n=1 Tax=Pseudoduganella plicata TaxID=321984 RepID=A0A4P7B9N3_9BURK|nr:hypothetical protein [Pseudoduganella plicata]QBQ35246.1 hypothetical protein E1742_02980 [Pseudoduganella plicata]GGZ04705.1 hypothetical protein GCM10007388_42850 [Pseudoduganella plicata]